MANPRNVNVNVTVNSDDPGDFSIEPSPLGSLPKGPDGELVFVNDHHPGFFIHFHLIDKSGLGYKFPPQRRIRSAVWSELGVDCCPQDGKMEVFKPIRVEDEEKTLVVYNSNQDPDVDKFYYMLRVTNDGGSSYLPLDPGGDNQNGPTQPFWESWLAPAATGAIVGFAAILLISNSLAPPNALLFGIGGAIVGLVVGLLLKRM